MKLYRFLGIALLFFCAASLASTKEQMPLEQRQKLEDIEKAIAAIGRLQAATEELSRARRAQCLQAFGHNKFCSCLAGKLPMALSFQQYVSITTNSKAENNYSKLNKENKEIYDLAVGVRDQCVNKL